jgi:hypothetical protein
MEPTTTPSNTGNTEQASNESINDFFTTLFQSKELGRWSRLLRRIFSFKTIWDDIFQTIVTLAIAVLVVLVLVYVKDRDLIDKSTFGVMFGTVIGYVLSWRFGK